MTSKCWSRFYKVRTIPEDLYLQCEELTFNDKKGTMRAVLVHRRTSRKESYALIATRNREVYGWSLITVSRRKRHVAASFFVKEGKRKQGIGRKIHNKVMPFAQKLADGYGFKVIVWTHDKASRMLHRRYLEQRSKR